MLNPCDEKNWFKLHSIFVSSLLLTILLYGIFMVQGIFSETVTFAKGGDQLRHCFPAFSEISKMLGEGHLSGFTLGTLNGGFDTFQLGCYLPMYFFAYLGNFLPVRFAYILFYAIHTFLLFYFGQKLSERYLQINELPSRLLLSFSFIHVHLWNSWFTAFSVMAALAIVGLYITLDCVHHPINLSAVLRCAFVYLLIFTSGYTPYACILALLLLVFSLLHGFWMTPERPKKEILFRAFLPGFLGGLAAVPKLLQELLHTAHYGGQSVQTLYHATELPLHVRDLLGIFLNSYIDEGAIEQIGILYIGLPWVLLLPFFVQEKITKKMSSGEKKIFWFGIILNILIVLLSLGTVTPLAAWFYMIPVFGQIHLPIRYLIVTLPFLFFSFTLAWKHIERGSDKLRKILCCSVVLGAGNMLMLQIFGIQQGVFQCDLLLYYAIWALVILCSSKQSGWRSRGTVSLLLAVLLLTAGKGFYDTHEVYSNNINSRSIALEQEALDRLDNFIDRLPQSERHLFVELDALESVPGIVPGYLDWYPWHRHNVTNFLSYPLHGSVLYKEYGINNQIQWYNAFNWGYLLDARADFIILDQTVYDQDAEFFAQIIDPKTEPAWLTQSLYLYKLKKFVPTPYLDLLGVSESPSAEYQGTLYYEDQTNGFDNGIFYSPQIRQDNVRSFMTDRRTYYQLDAELPEDCELLFLPYATPYLHFLMDDQEIEPRMENSGHAQQALISVPAGRHIIRVEYVQPLDTIKWTVILAFTALFCVVSAARYIKRGFRRGIAGRSSTQV